MPLDIRAQYLALAQNNPDLIPEGSTANALADQWMHAVAYGTDFFAKNSMSPDLMKQLQAMDSQAAKEYIVAHSTLPAKDTKFTFIDLFAGIGGMRIGFQEAGGTCVFSSEFDPKAQATYAENYRDFPFGDITKISENDIPDHDVLIGGFPCQPFSHAGQKLGIEDTRGTLFYDIARILETKKPKMALLENVKGLVSHNKGDTLKTILKALTSIGYQCIISDEIIKNEDGKRIKEEAKKMILSSVDFGVPQNRQRIYIVLWRKDLDLKFKYPQKTGILTKLGDILEKEPDPKYTLSDKLWLGHQTRKERNKANGKGFGYSLYTKNSPYAGTISARYYKDGSEILIEQSGKNPRKLTPREAARLQGFPEDFKLSNSEVQAYKQFGNSVSVPVIQSISEVISKFLKINGE